MCLFVDLIQNSSRGIDSPIDGAKYVKKVTAPLSAYNSFYNTLTMIKITWL